MPGLPPVLLQQLWSLYEPRPPTPIYCQPQGPPPGKAVGRRAGFPSPHLQTPRFLSSEPVNLPTSVTPSPHPTTLYTHRLTGLFWEAAQISERQRHWRQTKRRSHRTFGRLFHLSGYAGLFTGNYSNSPFRVVTENINNICKKYRCYSQPYASCGLRQPQRYAILYSGLENSWIWYGGGRGGILEPITSGYRGQLYYVPDMLKLLIYSVCGICMPLLEGVLRANDLT